MLGNLSPNFRSRVSSIQLVALAKSSIINTHGMDKILAPFIRDMEKLESVRLCIKCSCANTFMYNAHHMTNTSCIKDLYHLGSYNGY